MVLISNADADQSIYELRKLHNGGRWTDKTQTDYINWCSNDLLPLLADNGWDVVSFWVIDSSSNAYDKRTSGPAMMTHGKIVTGHENPEDSFPTAVCLLRWESAQQRDSCWDLLMGSVDAKVCLAKYPFHNSESQLEFELIEEHFFHNQLSCGMKAPCVAGRPKGGLHELRTYYFSPEKYAQLRSSEEATREFMDWCNRLMVAFEKLPSIKGRITCSFLNLRENDREIKNRRNYTSGQHFIDPEKHNVQSLCPTMFWSLHWDSKDQCDAAWAQVFAGDIPKTFFGAGGNVFNDDGLQSDMLKAEMQWMRSLV